MPTLPTPTLQLHRAIFFGCLLLFSLNPFRSTAAKGGELNADSLIHLGEKAVSEEQYVEAIQYFIRAKKMGEEAEDADIQYLSTYDMGVCYFYISEYAEAMNHYFEAYKLCTDHKMSSQRIDQVRVAIAGVYYEEGNMEKAAEILDVCYRNALSDGDSLSIQTYSTNLALICNKRKQYDQALAYLDEGIKWTDESNEHNRAISRVVRSETYFMAHRYADVKQLAEQILSDVHTPRNDRTVVLTYLMQIAREEKDYALALHYGDEALTTASAKNKPQLFEQLSIIYQELGQPERALSMKDSVITYQDSLTTLHNRQISENERVRMDIIQLRSDMQRNEAYLRQHRYISILLGCLCVLIVFAAYQILKNMRAKSRQARQLMKMEMEQQRQERLLMEKQMKEAELTALHQQEIARHEQEEARQQRQIAEMSLEAKKRELSATTMFVSSRNALIADLLASLSEVAKTNNSSKVNELIVHLKHLLNEHNKNNDFLVNFESANPDFIRKLKDTHPDLSSSDVRFLAYIRMNLSTKEIASLLGINPESCKRRKIRLSQKMGLASSASLYDHLMSF